MRAAIGLVAGFKTKEVENHDELFKWHLCACDRTHQYLFICGRQYDGDYRITNLECRGLHYQFSYISMRAVLFNPRIPANAKLGCYLTVDFLRGLYCHIQASDVMSSINKQKVLPGLARKISGKNAY
jgi:hypothetical protein